MANTPQAKKRIRRNANRSTINHARISRIRTFIKAVESAIDSGKKAEAAEAAPGEAPKKRTRKKNGKGTERVSQKARKANRVYSQWSFTELQALISYKAALAGSLVIKVDADYTSKACPMCGHTADENRPRKGLRFECQQCHYTLHADLIGARNVTLRTLLVRQDWIRTGTLSLYPDTSDKEAKAARLQRYAELRWSLDTSPAL